MSDSTLPPTPDLRAAAATIGLDIPAAVADDEFEAAVNYVRSQFFPPLPRLYGAWLVDLKHRAEAGADPNLLLAVPDAIMETGYVPRAARPADDGTTVITLYEALAGLRQEGLLIPADREAAAAVPEGTDIPEGVEMVTPVVALALANTADADTVGFEFDPDQVAAMSTALVKGEWAVDLDDPIHVDHQGRVCKGLNMLLAVVQGNIPAPVPIVYGYDDAARPLTWRGPAGWNKGPGATA